MPSEPTVDEVRELLKRAEKIADVLRDEWRHGYVPLSEKELGSVAALCRHFLAEAERTKVMTAGEFAGKAIGIIRGEQAINRECASQSLPGARDWYNGVHGGLEVAVKEIARFAREHNITIAEKP